MTPEAFDAVVEGRINSIRSVLEAKAREYGQTDRLHNFKEAAAMQRCTPQRALLGMLTKHLVSVIDATLDDTVLYQAAFWDEKIGDSVNYLILLEGILKERQP